MSRNRPRLINAEAVQTQTRQGDSPAWRLPVCEKRRPEWAAFVSLQGLSRPPLTSCLHESLVVSLAPSLILYAL